MNAKTLVIAVTQVRCNNIGILPPSHVYENDKIGHVIFHEDPRVETGSNLSNCDFHIDFNMGQPNVLHRHHFGDRYIHLPRVSKQQQYLNMQSFNKTVSEPLEMPTVYMSTQRMDKETTLPISNIGIPSCDKLVIKHAHGARGSNQLVVPTNMLQTVLKEAINSDLDLGGIKERFPDIILTEGSDTSLKLLDSYDNFVVTEFVAGIQKEWRLLVGGENIYFRERVINEGEYPQANLNVQVYHNSPVVEYKPLSESSVPPEVIKTLEEYIKYINLPIGSLDLYKDAEGRWGIFEYSPQFAFHGADPAFIRQIHLDAIESIIGDVI